MNATIKRALNAAIRAAESLNTASDKLATTTASFIKAAGGFDEALKLLNEQRPEGRTWKAERADNTPLYRVYNAVSVAKSRAKQAEQGQAGRTPQAGRAGRAGKAEQAEQPKAEQAASAKPASPAEILGVVLTWGPERIAQAIREQSAMLEQTAIDTLTDVLGILLNQAPKAPTKRAPRKTARK